MSKKRELRTVEPVAVDPRPVVLIGTICWFVAALALLPFWGWLGRNDHRVWFWTCVVGAGLGLIGLLLMGRHSREGRIKSAS